MAVEGVERLAPLALSSQPRVSGRYCGAVSRIWAAKRLHSTSPARPASTPARPASTPARPASTPARPASNPARPASTPARRASTPARRASTPARRASTPARRASTPARPASTPARRSQNRVFNPAGGDAIQWVHDSSPAARRTSARSLGLIRDQNLGVELQQEIEVPHPYSNPKLVMKRSRAFRRPYPAKALTPHNNPKRIAIPG